MEKELERLTQILDDLSCSSGKYQLVTQSISGIGKEKEMSKVSYDEALNILRNSLQDPQDEDDNCYILNRKQMIYIIRVIIQAQEKEKENE